MVDRTSAAPLIAINAVVMDTETTGLDAANARVIEIGAVRLAGGHVADEPPLRRLVRPDIPIPAELHPHPRLRRRRGCRRAAVRHGVAGAVRLFRQHRADRPLDRLRSRGAGARMQTRANPLAEPAEPLHAAALADRQSGACGFLARPRRRLAQGRGGRAAFRGGRCADRRESLREARALAAQSRHPDARRGDPRYRFAAAIDRRTASRRLDRRVRRAGRSARRPRAAHRHLSVPASRARHHDVRRRGSCPRTQRWRW